MTSSETACVTS